MNIENRQLIDYQVRSSNIDKLEYQLNLLVMNAAKNMTLEKMSKWNPYGNQDVLKAIRLSRLDESSVILFDLDGYDSYPEGIFKREGLYSLVTEAQDNFADIILGYPQTYVSFEKESHKSTRKIMWDVFDKENKTKEITVPDDVWDVYSVDVGGAEDPSDEVKSSRLHQLNYTRWSLNEKALFVQAFLNFADDKDYDLDGSWLVSAITKETDGEETHIDKTDPLGEVMLYIDDLDQLGLIELASTKNIEKYLVRLARRVHEAN